VTEASPLEARRVCRWCRGPIPDGKRSDASTCSKPCRQAAHRFRVGVAPAEAAERPMRFAYADPPYPGLARRYYGPEAREVDHAELVARLERDFPDGWALSTSADALRDVLALCPAGTRVCPWVRGPRKVKSRAALVAWEPLLVVGGRRRRVAVAEDLCDVLIWGGRQHSHPDALVGMKPAAFAEWMFRLLGARQGDELVDLFPGSGAIARAWEAHTRPELLSATGRAELPATGRTAPTSTGRVCLEGDATRPLERTATGRHLEDATGSTPATRRRPRRATSWPESCGDPSRAPAGATPRLAEAMRRVPAG
jgi:hypothetical protein